MTEREGWAMDIESRKYGWSGLVFIKLHYYRNKMAICHSRKTEYDGTITDKIPSSVYLCKMCLSIRGNEQNTARMREWDVSNDKIGEQERASVIDFIEQLLNEGINTERIIHHLFGHIPEFGNYVNVALQNIRERRRSQQMSCKFYHIEVRRAEQHDPESLFLDPTFMEGYFGKDIVGDCYDYKKSKEKQL